MTRLWDQPPPGRNPPPRGRAARRALDAEVAHQRLVRLRAAAVFVILGFAMAGVGARLVMLHVVQAATLRALAERQQRVTVAIDAGRGRLLDRSGRPLAVNVEAHSAFAVPSRMTDPWAFARQVAPILGRRSEDLARQMRPGRHFEWLVRKAPDTVIARLRGLSLDDQIGFLAEARRVYPNGSLAAHVIGFAGLDNQGLDGAELAFDRYLRGRAGLAVVERDAMGRPRPDTYTVLTPPADGADVVLTLDQVLQHIAERELDRALATTRAVWGTVLMMDPQTGEILALASAPRFSPNAFDQASAEVRLHRALTTVLEPGSTFKIVLAAAALEAGAVDEDDVFTSNGTFLAPGRHVIREARGKVYARQTLADIVRHSSNVGAAMVATRLGKARFHEAIRRFGFGAPTGIDLPGEAAGLVPPPEEWLGPGLQTIGFGQGISVTPLQLLVAGAALANEGLLVRPHVLRAVRDAEGRALVVTTPTPVGRAVSPAAARAVLAMMEESVLRGTGTQARLDGYRVAGKTGTAQKPSPAGGYRTDVHLASFFGVVPVVRPRLAILVMLDEPRGDYFGGLVAAPVFRSIAAQSLWHLRVPPDAAAVLPGQ